MELSNYQYNLMKLIRRYAVELTLTLLIISGRFGFISQETAHIPRVFSFSTIFLLILISIFFFRHSQRKCPSSMERSLLFVNAFIAVYLLIGLVWSPSEIYAIDKALNHFLYVFLGLTLLLLLGFDIQIFSIIFHAIVSLVGTMAVLHNFTGMPWGGVKAPGIGLGMNSFARLMVYGVLLNIGILLTMPFKNRYVRFFYIVTLTLLLSVVFASVSRGSIIGLMVCLFIVFVFIKEVRIKLIKFAIVAVPVILSYLWLVGILYTSPMEQVRPDISLHTPQTLYTRFSLFFSQDKGASVNVRQYSILKSLEYLMEGGKYSVFGYGTGAFAPLVWNVDKIDYPHNLNIEILVEFGFVGFILVNGFIFFIIYQNRQLFKQKAHYTQKMLFVCFIFSILTAQVTGDLFDNRFVWWFGILSVIYLRKEKFAEFPE